TRTPASRKVLNSSSSRKSTLAMIQTVQLQRDHFSRCALSANQHSARLRTPGTSEWINRLGLFSQASVAVTGGDGLETDDRRQRNSARRGTQRRARCTQVFPAL